MKGILKKKKRVEESVPSAIFSPKLVIQSLLCFSILGKVVSEILSLEILVDNRQPPRCFSYCGSV